jgi:hypothetical protein
MKSVITSLFILFWSHCLYAKSDIVVDIAYADQHLGQSQHVNIVDLIGNDYTVNQSRQSNVMVGLSYYRPYVSAFSDLHFLYGLNLAFFNTNQIQGDIVQENLFSNLSYSYNAIHLPIYASLKTQVKSWVLEAGIGPNIMFLYNYHENAIQPSSIPTRTFLSNTAVTFSANAGLAYQFPTSFLRHPIELGYRFFYLGKGQFSPSSNQVLSALKTSNIYVNTLVFSITFED